MNKNTITPFLQWCDDLRISPVTGYSWIRKYKIRTVKIGNKMYVPEAEKERLVRENTREPGELSRPNNPKGRYAKGRPVKDAAA